MASWTLPAHIYIDLSISTNYSIYIIEDIMQIF